MLFYPKLSLKRIYLCRTIFNPLPICKQKKRSGITKKNIKSKLLDELDNEIADKIFTELYESRTITETTVLKRQ